MWDLALWSNRMQMSALAIGALLSAGAPGHVWAAEADGRMPAITVSGRAEVATAPDAVYVTLAVESMAPTAADAAEDNRVRSERVIAAAKKFLAQEGQISTTGFRLVPVYETPDKRPQQAGEKRTLVGYEVHNEVTVELRDLTQSGRLVDAGIAAGADRIAGMRFDLVDRQTALREAVVAAGRDATAQAEALAAALGVRLGKIRLASTVREPIRFPQDRAIGRAVMAAAHTPIEPGDVTVSASVDVTYDIAP
jgi:uncharacterized protein YggE